MKGNHDYGYPLAVKKIERYFVQHPMVAHMTWLVMACVFLVIDLLTGPFIRFPVTLLIPIVFATWFSGGRLGLTLAIILPVIRFGFNFTWNMPLGLFEASINTMIQVIVFVLLASLTQIVARQNRLLSAEVRALEKENSQLEALRQTMVTVNDIVLNDLQYLQFMLTFPDRTHWFSPSEIDRIVQTIARTTMRLNKLSAIEQYRTAEVVAGVRAVVYDDDPVRLLTLDRMVSV